MSARLVAQKYEKSVCLEGLGHQNTTKQVCLEGWVHKNTNVCKGRVANIRKNTYVWKAWDTKIRRNTYVWKAGCTKIRRACIYCVLSAVLASKCSKLRFNCKFTYVCKAGGANIRKTHMSARLGAPKYDKTHMCGRLGAQKYECLQGSCRKKYERIGMGLLGSTLKWLYGRLFRDCLGLFLGSLQPGFENASKWLPGILFRDSLGLFLGTPPARL